MVNLVEYELLFFVLSFVCFWTTTWAGSSCRKRSQKLEGENRGEFLFALGGTLTLNIFILAGMNEVIDFQGYAQAVAWNRIPIAAGRF